MPEREDQRRLAAIVSADVVAYTRLMERDEIGTHARLRARFNPDCSGALYDWTPGRCCLTLGLREDAHWNRLRRWCDIGYPNARTASLYDVDKDFVQQRAVRRVEVAISRKLYRIVILNDTDFVIANSRPGEEITHTRLVAFEKPVT